MDKRTDTHCGWHVISITHHLNSCYWWRWRLCHHVTMWWHHVIPCIAICQLPAWTTISCSAVYNLVSCTHTHYTANHTHTYTHTHTHTLNTHARTHTYTHTHTTHTNLHWCLLGTPWIWRQVSLSRVRITNNIYQQKITIYRSDNTWP